MPESRYEVLALFTGAMVGASLSVMGSGTLMPFYAAAFHLGQSQLGWILSVQMIGSVGMTAVAGMLTDRFGDKAVVLWSGVIMGLALIAASLVPNFTWLLFWLLLYGIGFAAVTPAGSHAIIFFFKQEERGLAMGIRQCGVPLAGALAGVLLPAIALRFHYQAALAVCGIVTLLACALASIFYREPAELQGERVSVRAMLIEMVRISRDVRLILLTLASMVLTCSQFALMGFLTLTVIHWGYAVSVAVALFTLAQIAAMAGRLGWGWGSDHVFKGSRAIPLGIIGIATAAIAFGISSIGAGAPFWLAAALAAGLGFTAEGWLGLSVCAFAEIGGNENAGSALGVGLTWTLVAAFVTPTLFGALAQAHGFPFAWRSLALLEAIGVVPALLASETIARSLRADLATAEHLVHPE
jgi:MFS family permease